MRKLLAALAVVAACGDNGHEPTPDVAVVADELVPRCVELDQPDGEVFARASDFGSLTPGSLAGWNPDGRWFLTGVRVGGVSSFQLERRAAQVIVDRDDQQPGTIDDDAVFQRRMVDNGEAPYAISMRVSDLRADGSLRADRAVCDGVTCRWCTARMIRATHNGEEGESDHLSLVGELRGSTWTNGYTFNVRVVGTLAYLIRQDGLYIIDTSDPTHPTQLGHYRRSGDGYSNDVKLVDAGAKRYALIADSPVDVVDVTDPTQPVLARQILEEAHTLFTEVRGGKTYAYFGNYNGSTPIYDVTDPAAPSRLARYQSGGSVVHDLMVDNGIAYLDAWDAGLQVVDFTQAVPTRLGAWAPTPTGTSHSSWATTAGGRKVVLHGEEAYGAHLDVVDADPSSATFMQSLGAWKTRDWVSIHNVMAIGDRAYIAYYQDGIRVLDLADPANPRPLGYFNTWDPQAAGTTSAFFEGAVGLDVDPVRKLIFVADSPRGLLILRDETN